MGKLLTIFFPRLGPNSTRPVGISYLLIELPFYDVGFFPPIWFKRLGERGGDQNV